MPITLLDGYAHVSKRKHEHIVWLIDTPDVLYARIVKSVLGLLGKKHIVEYVEAEGISFRAGVEQPDIVVVNYDIEGRERVLSIAKVLPDRTDILVLVSGKMSQTAENVLRARGNVQILRYG